MLKNTLIFLVGPTAVGKSETAIHLAKKINAQIISCDSMQLYKGMDILTSKPPLSLRKKVGHHLIDIISPTREYNVASYSRQVKKKIKQLLGQGKTPLFVGGTGLYMSILLDGIFKEPRISKSIRLRLYKELEKLGTPYLYKRLSKVDPAIALKIHPNDSRRIIRALEVFRATGKPISYLQKQRKGLADLYQIKIFCLNMPRKKLYQRIDKRVDKMFAQGLLSEVKKLLRLKLSRTASSAIGIKELKGYFGGLYDLEEATRLIKRNCRHFAKRQLTWFRKDKRLERLDIGDKERPRETAIRIWKRLF